VVEEDARASVEVVALAVIDRDVVAVDLGHTVGTARVKRGPLALRRLLDLAEHFARGGLVKAGPGANLADPFQDARDAHRGELGGQDRLLPAGRHEGHRRQVVDLVRLDLLQEARDGDPVEQVALDQLDLVAQVLDAGEVLGAGAAHHAVNAVALFEQQLGEVRTVLAGDAGDECGRHGGAPWSDAWKEVHPWRGDHGHDAIRWGNEANGEGECPGADGPACRAGAGIADWARGGQGKLGGWRLGIMQKKALPGAAMQERIAYQGITFDDVLLEPGYSDVLPRDVDVRTQLTRNIRLNIPIVSSPMDTVTESELAIALAQEGGIGVIHKNMSTPQQTREVDKVKRSENGIITDPIPLPPDESVGTARRIMEQHNISGVPITVNGFLRGILTRRDLR